MHVLRTAATLLALSTGTVVHGQSTGLSSWTEPTSGVVYKLAIPDKSSAPFPILMSITAPANITYAAWAAGGCMLRSPLLVAVPGAKGASVEVRPMWATQYHPPAPYANSTVTVFKTSAVNTTHWTANFLCSAGCSSWYGGEIDPNFNNATFGFGISSLPTSGSSIRFHNVAKGHFDIDLTKAKRADFDAMAKAAETTAL